MTKVETDTHTKTQTVHLGTAKTGSPTKWIACMIVSAMDTKTYVLFYAGTITQQRYVHLGANLS